MKTVARLEKIKGLWFLIATIFAFFLLRLPSLYEPYWYGDEGIYQVLGVALRQGRLLYRDIWDNKPPLLYLLYGLFNSDQFAIRFVSLLFGILTVIFIYLLLKELFKEDKSHKPNKDGSKINNTVVLISTFLFAFLFATPLLEGNIANAENFMLLPIVASGFLAYRFVFSPKPLLLFLAGLLLSSAFLFKIVAVFDFAAFFLFLFFVNYANRQKIVKLLLAMMPLIIGFILPIFIVLLFFLFNNALSDFITAVFKQNVGYVGYGNKFLIPQGLLFLKLLLLGLFLLVLFSYRKRLTTNSLFIYIWLSFSLFNALFSQRPYTHYLLVLLPSFILLCALIFFHILHKNRRLIVLSLLFFIFLVYFIFNSFSLYKKSVFYYANFASFLFAKKSVFNYQYFFDANTPKDYALAQFIKLHTTKDDSIFIWGDNAQVYKLANKLPIGRFTVAYHILANKNTIKETEVALAKKHPKYIIIVSSQKIPFSLLEYSYKYTVQDRLVYEYTP